jgi:hypothetical protein
MTKWIKHNGGPSPVASDVWVLAEYRMPKQSGLLPQVATAASVDWEGLGVRRYCILNQHLIDAAQLRVRAFTALAARSRPGRVLALEAALAFYANIENWQSPSRGFALQYDPQPSPVSADRGGRALAALATPGDDG